ncbi:PP2C family protein-serine/threonine phosphatase [bacterium]|nr:PP2C family protein-serine/threonine phosphatase [bacterium]
MDPKTFYRELDAILNTIKREKSGEFFFTSILKEMEKTFGEKLGIINSHVFERRGKSFVKITDCSKDRGIKLRASVSEDLESVRDILKQGVVVFESREKACELIDQDEKHCGILAAIHVHKSVRRWLLIFQLEADLVTEELLLFLNSMRTAINYRLFSEMMRNDLKRAEEIQRSLLPGSPLKIAGYDIAAVSMPAEVVGGDFYEYFKFSDEDFGVAIGDASGHGIPAALLVRDVVIGLRMGMARDMRLVQTINKLNQVIQMSTYATNFVSLFVGEIERGGHLFYINAGHPAPFLVRGDEIHDLEATGMTLGFMPDIDMHRSYIKMDPGSVLVLYTDGIIEREENADNLFEVDRLKDIVVFNQHKKAEKIVKAVIEAVDKFGKEKTLEDDVTIVVIKRLA